MTRSLSYRKMTRLKDEEDPAEVRTTSRLGCKFSRFGMCCAKVRERIRDKLENWKWKVEKFWKENRLVIRPCWDIVLVTSCVLAVSLDPLFFYIPTINGDEKCLQTDTKLRVVALVSRLLTDIILIFHILDQVYKASAIAEMWRSLAIDILSLLPAPQVLIAVIFYKNPEFGYLDLLKIINVCLLIQYAPRIYRLNQSFINLTRKKRIRLWVKIAFNFFQYILACHILGAAWFFFSIQREMLCWHQTCVKHDTCETYFKCNNKSPRNVTKLVELCPMNPANSTVYDFGIFVNPLGTSSKEPINFATKFSYSFWWGVRNLSNFGTNLQTSTSLFENWFASLISIIGLLLFVYLIGNNVQTYMQMKTTKAEEEAERMRQKFLHQQTRINLWMGRNFDSYLRKEIETKMREKYQENKEVNLDNVLTLLSLLGPDDQMYARDKICQKMLESVPVFKDMGLTVLSAISKKMEKVVYQENTLIVKMDDPLDRMVFITEGSMGIYTTTSTADSSPSTIIQGSLEECSIYGHKTLLTWLFSPNVSLDCLPISKKTVKCHTRVEGFVLTATDLKAILSFYCIIEDSISGDEDDVEIGNSTEGESSSSGMRSAVLVARAVSRFQRRIRSKKPGLDFDPSSYKGL